MKIPTPIKAIRAKCLDCHGNNLKGVQFCPADGVNSTWCALWPYRFGMSPKRARRTYPDFMDPQKMPDGDIPLDELRHVGALHPAAAPGATRRRLNTGLFQKRTQDRPPTTTPAQHTAPKRPERAPIESLNTTGKCPKFKKKGTS